MNRLFTLIVAVFFIVQLMAGYTTAAEKNIPTKKIEGPSEMLQKIMPIYNKGVKLLETKKYSAALSDFKSVIHLAENSSDSDVKRTVSAAANNAGNIFLLRGDIDSAEKMFSLAVKEDSLNALAFNGLGTTKMRGGEFPEAIGYFEKAIKTNPLNIMPLNNLASLLIVRKDLKRAAKYLVASLEIDQTNHNTLLLMAKLYDVAKMPEMQEKIWLLLLKLRGNDDITQIKLIALYIQEGLVNKAEERIEKVLKNNPKMPEALLLKSRLLTLQKKYTQAEEILLNLRKNSPDDITILNDLVWVMLQHDQALRAINLLEQEKAKSSFEAQGWFLLGSCQEKIGNLKEAENSYRQAIKINPEHAKALNNLGVLAAKDGAAKKTVNFFARAVAADPLYDDARYNLGRALIVSQLDYVKGVKILASVTENRGPAAPKARRFLQFLEDIRNDKNPTLPVD